MCLSTHINIGNIWLYAIIGSVNMYLCIYMCDVDGCNNHYIFGAFDVDLPYSFVLVTRNSDEVKALFSVSYMRPFLKASIQCPINVST